MRLGIDAHNLEGERTGVGRYLLNILRNWPELLQENEHIFLYFKKEIPDLQELRHPQFTLRLLPSVLGKQSTFLFTHVSLPRAAAQDKIDLLWCPAYIGPLLWQGKVALTLHDIIFSARPDLYDWPSVFDRVLLAWVAKRIAQKAERIFVPSEFTRKEVLRLYRVRPERITVITLGVDPEFFERAAPEEEAQKIRTAKARYCIGDRYFLFYGTMFTRRRIPECLEAFTTVAKEYDDLEFLLGGKNMLTVDFADLVKSFNKKLGRKAIHWVPYIPSPDLRELIRGSQAVLYLSEYEGFGLPVAEAFAAGAPVICSKTSSLIEVGANCALFMEHPIQSKIIASSMRKILSGRDFQFALRMCGVDVAKKYRWKETAALTLQRLREIV